MPILYRFYNTSIAVSSRYTITAIDCGFFLEVELFLKFKTQHLDITICHHTFEYLKPYFVCKLKDSYTCCCILYVQMSFLKDAMNHMKIFVFSLHGNDCQCLCNLCKDNYPCKKATKNQLSAWQLLGLKPPPCGKALRACKKRLIQVSGCM